MNNNKVGWHDPINRSTFTHRRKFKWNLRYDRGLIGAGSFIKLYHFTFNTMNSLFVFCCLFLSVSAIRQKEKKITLHDIEQDFVMTQKRIKLSPPPLPKAQSPTQYGFVPVKTAVNYVQQEAPTSYLNQYNQFLGTQSQYSSPQYSVQPDYSQYSTMAYSGDSSSNKFSTQPDLSALTKYTQAKFVSQPSVTYAQNSLQNIENIQYITDNSIAPTKGQTQSAQQYYNPQYLYIQQYQAPSTSVQTVVDPKGGQQYVSYVPTYVPKANTVKTSENYENVAYTIGTQDTSSIYQAPQTPQYSNVQYQQSYQPVQYIQPQSNYVQKQILKREPKSLLDSYVPSYLQIQYMNRLKQQNDVQEQVVKIPRKTSYRTVSHNPAESSVRYSYLASPYRFKS